jgi:hypothetical protein
MEKEEMKPRWTIVMIAIGIWLGGILPSTAQSPPTQSTPPEGAEQSDPDTTLEFESETPERISPTDREEEAIRFHEHTVLDRFENSDDQGQLFLSFPFEGGADLVLRGANGAEAPIADLGQLGTDDEDERDQRK